MIDDSDEYLSREIDRTLAASLLARGRFTAGTQATLQRGADNHCLLNAQAIALARDDATLILGFALGTSGTWYSHAWVRLNDGSLIETTVPRIGYFGMPA